EGMFLEPHHLQAAARHLTAAQQTADAWDHAYHWGLREFVLDPDALANHRLVIRRLHLRLRDGTLVSVPEDDLPALDLRTLLTDDVPALIRLGVPALHQGRPNVADAGGLGGRFLVRDLELEDENTGLNPQPLQVRRLNLRLLVPHQDRTGFETLPLV